MPRFQGITDEMIIEKHCNGCSYKEIQAFCGLSDRAIRNILVKYGVPLRKQYAGQPRKHQVNEHFFKTWSHEMAWVLGFFVADGHIVKDAHQICFSQKKDDVLKVIASYLNADLTIQYSDHRVPTLIINSKIMKQDLMTMGVTNNKSFDMPFPNVPEKYLPSFIRGIIDGDGWVDAHGYGVKIVTGSIQLAKGIKHVFENWNLCSEITSEKTVNQKTIYRVSVIGKNDTLKLSEIIYNTPLSTKCLEYKRLRMSQHNDFYHSQIISNEQLKIKDNGRVHYKTYINKKSLEILRQKSKQDNLPVSYLLEMGFQRLVNDSSFTFDKSNRLRNKEQIHATCDKELFNQVKAIGKKHRLNFTDVIQVAIEYID